MLLTVIERRERIGDREIARRWDLPEGLIRYQSPRCTIAAGPDVSVARRLVGASATASAIVAAFEGRLDNRDELLAHCGLDARTAISDGAIMCALYARSAARSDARAALESECTVRPVGDFRFVVYDERDHTLLCAVDFACTRTLWWRECGPRLIVSSRIGELYPADESVRLNDDYLVERLASGWNNGRDGPLEGAWRLLPGELLHVSARAASVRKYWCPSMFVAASSGTRSEEDCVAEFAHLLGDGVERRLPHDRPVLCDLSGGLDSTSITAIASRRLGTDAPRRLHALTVSYPGAPKADERTRAASVAQAARATHHILEWPASEPLYAGMPDNAHYWDEPRFNVHSHLTALAKHRLLQSIGTNVVLSGAGAEPVLCEHMDWPVFLADALIRGRWREVVQGVRQWQDARRSPLLVLLYRSCVAPLVRPVAAITHEARQVMPLWLTPRTVRRFKALRRAQLGPAIDRRNTAGSWMSEQWQAAASARDQGYSAYAFDTRCPFLHKPLVESVLRMPWNVRVVAGTNKLLLRRLARDLLPPGFATRASRAADQAVAHALAAQDARVKGFITPSVLAQLDYVDETRLRHALCQAQNGFGRGLRFLVTVLAIELWTRSVVSGEWHRLQHSLRPSPDAAPAYQPLSRPRAAEGENLCLRYSVR